MSKNNVKEISKCAFNQSQHYALRKLSVGVASVLIGTTMYVGLAHADTVSINNESTPIAQASAPTIAQQSSNENSSDIGSNVVTSSSKQLQQSVPVGSSNEIVKDVNQSSVDQSNNSSSSAYNVNDQQNSFDLRKTVNQNSAISLEQSNVQENNNIAKNVKGQWIWHNGQTPSTTSVSEQTIGGNYEYRMGAKFSFDVDGSQLKQGNIIDVAHISQTSSNSGMAAFNSENVDVPVLIDGRKIGYLSLSADTLSGDPNVNSSRFSRLNYRLRVTEPNLNYQGIQHISVVAPWLGTLNYYSTWSFRGVKDSLVDFHFYGDGLDEHYKVHYSWPDNLDFSLQHQMGYSVEVAGGSFLSDNGCTDPVIIFRNPLLKFANSSQLGLFNQSAGKQGSIDVTNKSIDYGMRFYLDHGNSVLLSNVLPKLGVQFSFPVVNSDGSIVSSSQYPAYNWMDTRYMTLPYNFSARVVASNLTLSQLKKLNVVGAVISRQSDGSALVYYHFPLADMQMDFSKISDYALQRMISMSPYINYSANSYADAVDMVKKMFATWSSPSMQSIPTSFSAFINWVYVSDSSTHPSMHVELLDPDTGTVLHKSVEPGNYSTIISHGQSTVKFHVITPSGVALQQVKSFTDWPNQNKHASLSIPSITGYELVSNPQSVLSALHLSGTAISSSVQVDYPAENTVADYYVVLQPKTESATVQIVDADESNKVLATGTVSGRFGEQIVSSADIQSKLDSLIKTGHYVLTSNGFDNATDYNDGTNTITISLKHKLDSTQRHYRVIENLPDGTKKVIVDFEVTLYKDSNNGYYNDTGAYVDGSGNTLLKPNDVVDYAGIAPDGQNPSTWLKAKIDYLPGYVMNFADNMGAYNYKDGVNVSLGDNNTYAYIDLFDGSVEHGTGNNISLNPLSSRDFHITYSRRSYPVTVNYYDLSGALISSSKSQHLFADSVDVAPSIPANYVLAPGQTTHLTVVADTSSNTLDLVVIPRVTVSTDSRTVTRTIQITRPDGTVQSVVQSVQFTRPAYKNVVTNSIQYGSWTSPARYFTSYQPDTVSGYVSPTVASQQITPDSVSSVVRVSYKLLQSPQIPPYIDAAGHNYATLPAGYHVVAGQSASSTHASVLIAKDVAPIVRESPQYVTRTVTITLLSGHKRVIHQRVRKGTRFGKVAIPKLRGYKVVISGDSQELGPTSADRNIDMSVKFVKM